MELVPVENNCNIMHGGPSFFKIIFGSAAMETLRIPPHFMKHLENEVADRAILESPSGDLWSVVLHKKENGMYLQDGWPDFARNHNLGKNEFLLFKYNGNLHFSVRIYDANGLERVGTNVTCQHRQDDSSKGKNKIDSLQLHQLDDLKPSKPEAALTGIKKRGIQRKKVGPINLHQPEVSAEPRKPEAASSSGKRKRGRPKKKVDPINLPLTEYAPKEHGVDPINLPRSESCKHALDAASKEKKKCGRPRKNEAIDALILYQSEPCKHATKVATSLKRKQGRPIKKDDLLHQSKSRKYAQGVKKFKKIKHTERKIKEKEMDPTIVESDTLLKVNEEDKDKRERKKKISKTHKEHHSREVRHTERKIKEEKMDAPIVESNLQLKVNEEEKKEDSSRKKRKCKKHEEQHSWMVKHTERIIKEEKVDPTIKEADSQLEVNEEEKDNSERKKRKCEKHKEHHSQTMQPPTEEERATVLEKADSFISRFPYYKCSLRHFEVQKMFLLPISKSFSQAHFPSFKTEIVLWNSKGKGWIVNVIPVKGRHSFSKGWRSFVLDNRLKEGDVCIFELVKKSEMKVHVFRVDKVEHANSQEVAN